MTLSDFQTTFRRHNYTTDFYVLQTVNSVINLVAGNRARSATILGAECHHWQATEQPRKIILLVFWCLNSDHTGPAERNQGKRLKNNHSKMKEHQEQAANLRS